MNQPTGRLALLLLPLLLAACGSAQQSTARLLNDRLQDRLGPDIKAGQVALQRVPDGARVTLLQPGQFPDSKYALDDKYPDIRANVIEGMLDPSLMRVRVTDTTTLPADQREIRVHNVSQYFAANGLNGVLQPADPMEAASAGVPAGVAITINVRCPQGTGGTGYDGGLAHPVCE